MTATKRPHRIVKDKNLKDLKAVIEYISSFHNPFSEGGGCEVLINIGTGKIVLSEIAECILCVKDAGRKAREQFIKECSENSGRFKKTLKRLPIRSFAT